VIDAPTHGSVISGDPAGIVVHVVAHHSQPGEPCQVQVLDNPNDLTSWTTIGTGTSDTSTSGLGYGFALDVRPVNGASDARRWPAGGVLRLRVIDADATPFTVSGFETDHLTTLAIVNPQPPPADWAYLENKPVGSVAETQAYYAATNAPATLAAFMTTYGFVAGGGSGEIAATYYNAGDLAVGREMHCRTTTTPANGVACYVGNFGGFDSSVSAAFTALETPAASPIATVAMVFTPPITSPNSVTFAVYNPSGALQDSAQLDTFGDNTSIPQNCLNCHGAASTYDTTSHSATNARFLPFDPAALQFAPTPGLGLADQLPQLYQLNQLVLAAAPTTADADETDGLFPAPTTYQPTFIPTGWSATASDRAMYQQVVAPYCRGCHASHQNSSTAPDPLAFETASDFRASAASIIASVCGTGPNGMPGAQASAATFFASGARGLLLTYFAAPGACAGQ
jgi:mono/diheme cytochrome c family protein